MSDFQDVQDFISQAHRVTRIDDLKSLLDGLVRELGFRYFALVHHIDIHDIPAETVSIVEYPESWAAKVIAFNYFADDTVNAACQKTATGFLWSNIGELIALTDRHREILASAEQEGLGEGFTVPIHIPGEFSGSCSFSVPPGTKVSPGIIPALQYTGMFAFEAARRISCQHKRTPQLHEPDPPKITGRQLDCIALVARGKSDWDAAQLLGISKATVHQHLEEAKRRYGVHSRAQLIVRTLYDSRLTFGDLVGK